MEASLLARLVVELLVSQVKNISTSIDGTVTNGKNLYDTIQNRFAEEADDGKASKSLKDLEKDPSQRKDVEHALSVLLKTDPAFVDALRSTKQIGFPQKHPPQDNDSRAKQRLNATLSTSYQQIKVEKRSTVENIRMSIKND